MGKKLVTVTTDVDVEVSLSDFDTDDLVEELEERGVSALVPGSDRLDLLGGARSLFLAGRDREALDLLRDTIEKQLSCILPASKL